MGLAARRPQPSCPLVLEINAGGVVRLLTFWRLDDSEVYYKRASVCLALGYRWYWTVSHTPNNPRDLVGWQSAAIEFSCILETRWQHRQFSKTVSEQLTKMAGG